MAALAEKIRQLVLQESPAFNLFLVGEYVAPGNIQLTYFLDSETPLNMQVLTEFSRHINKIIDEGEFGEKKFTIDFSSPGADKPLVDIRQYNKHLGRTLELAAEGFDLAQYKLLEIKGEILVCEQIPIKKMKHGGTQKAGVEAKIVEIPFAQITSATVVLSFK